MGQANLHQMGPIVNVVVAVVVIVVVQDCDDDVVAS